MAQLRLDLDGETYQRLLETALSERRPVPLQAEVVIRQALGLPFPYPTPNPGIEHGPDAPRTDRRRRRVALVEA
jgi:hypothetical protein